MPTPSRSRTGQIVLSVAFLALAASGTAACGAEDDTSNNATSGDKQDYKFYCTNAEGDVVDEDACGNDGNGGGGGGGFFFMMLHSSHPTTYATGQRIPASVGAPRIAATDKAARTSWGLPATGRVTNGTVKTGIVGKGGGAPVGAAGGGRAPGAGGAKGGSGSSGG